MAHLHQLYKTHHKKIEILLLFFVVAIFSYLRLHPIYTQELPYTYDQGRDFLKAEEIVRGHHLTFIGPTTGVMGLFHGAWWYYFLSIVFFIFQGWPIGFYIGMFFINCHLNMSFLFLFEKRI